MARAYDRDLRVRVVEAIEAGATGEAAAERFGIGKSTAGAWARLKRATGDVTPGKQGQPAGSKLDVHADFILALVEAQADLTLAEIGSGTRHAGSAGNGLACLRPARDHAQKACPRKGGKGARQRAGTGGRRCRPAGLARRVK
jgi:transposase-like protein